mmetsp:Transcript_28246/g.68747  ORF Transcript_28246/g.68747 Transcript_28246/m.68747 type:complete len:222 (+) Transcript_28246:138-803(+)
MGCTTSTTTQTISKVDNKTETGSDHNNNDNASNISPTLALGAGCYWGTEKFIVKNFQKKFPNSILEDDTKVGFMSVNPNNPLKNPNYKQVCAGNSGYIEVLNIKLNNPTPELFEELIRFFFTFHDPTTPNRQGNDWGSQYASVIFCSDEQQVQIARKVKSELQTLVTEKKIKAFAQKQVSTGIVEYTKFIKATAQHQRYLAKHPFGYCNHRIRFKNWPKQV